MIVKVYRCCSTCGWLFRTEVSLIGPRRNERSSRIALEANFFKPCHSHSQNVQMYIIDITVGFCGLSYGTAMIDNDGGVKVHIKAIKWLSTMPYIHVLEINIT